MYDENENDPTKEELENINTRDDYMEIADYIVPNELKKELYKHQKQMIAWALEAESESVISNERGQFYSRIGVNASSPGSGKTAAMLGLSFFDVEEPAVPDGIVSTSLITVIINQPRLEYIPCSIYLAPNNIISNWKNDCNTFYGQGHYYEITTESAIMDEIRKEGFYSQNSTSSYLNDQYDEVDKIVKKLSSIRVANRTNEDLNNLTKYKNMRKKLKEEIELSSGGGIITEFLIHKMKQYRVILCGATSFQFLIPTFEKVKVNRLCIDEMQDILITNQDNFKLYNNDSIVNFLIGGHGKRITETYRQLSPARMIWLVTATPYLITSQEKTKSGAVHYFNMWIGRNAQFLRDYVNSVSGKYMLPDMIRRYIIKFPDTYIHNIIYGNQNFIRTHVLKCRKSSENSIFTGILDSEFDEYLENDETEKIMSYLNIHNINDIYDGVINKINEKINDVHKRVSEYKVTGERLINLKEEADAEINGYNNKFAIMENRIDNYTNVSSGDEYIFESKMDALISSAEQGFKVLIYINTSDQGSSLLTNIVKELAQKGFRVRIPTALTKAENFAIYGKYEKYIINPRDKRHTQEDLDDFEHSTYKTVWILKSGVSSAGMNFPFIDMIITYSHFKSEEQIIGRANRPTRKEPFDFIKMVYVD